MSAQAQMEAMLAKETLLSAVSKRKADGDIDSEEEEKKVEEIDKLTALRVKQAKRAHREAGHGRQAHREQAQNALLLKTKTYSILVGRYANPKAARDELAKALTGWITSVSGLRGGNPSRSHHGTKDMFFLVNAKGKEEQATIHLADDSADTAWRMPATNQGGQPACAP